MIEIYRYRKMYMYISIQRKFDANYYFLKGLLKL